MGNLSGILLGFVGFLQPLVRFDAITLGMTPLFGFLQESYMLTLALAHPHPLIRLILLLCFIAVAAMGIYIRHLRRVELNQRFKTLEEKIDRLGSSGK